MWSKSAKKQRFGQVSQSGLNRVNELVAQQTRARGGAGVASFGWGSSPSYRQGVQTFRVGLTGPDGIPAAGTQPGSALGSADDVTDVVCQQDGLGNASSVQGDTQFTAYNLSSSAVGGNAVIICAKVNGIWICIWEDCSS